MKEELRNRCKNFFYSSAILLSSLVAKSQNINPGDGVNFVGSINGYSQPFNGANDYRVLKYRKVSTAGANPNDGRGQWVTTINVQNSGGNVTPSNMTGGGGNGFLFTSGGGAGNQGNYGNKWAFGGVGQGAINGINGTGFNGSTDMGLNMGTSGKYTFVFKDAGYTATSFYVGYTTNDPVSITHNPATQLIVANAIGTVNATLSATPSPQENFFVRYRTATNSFSATANVVQASISGTTITATIPAQPATTVYYYVFSSTRTLAQLTSSTAGDIALSALRFDDNLGANYSYAVVAAPAQPGNISGNAIVCANSSQTYSVANDPAATSYTWTLPSGWSGTSNTNSITVTTGAVGGTLSVTATNNSGTSPSASLSAFINSGTSITAQPVTTTQNLCVGTTVSPLSVTADGSMLTYQWYSNTIASNSGGTPITGATASSYTPKAASAGTLYYYVVVGGACTPTSVTSNISGAITISGLANDNAGNGAYNSGWTPGSNGGGGFGPWTFTSNNVGTGGSFIGGSDIGASSFGLYANSGAFSGAIRPFATPLPIGNTVSFDLDNGYIDDGGAVGVRIRNASGDILTEFRFIGGNPQYAISDGSGITNTGIGYTGNGLNVSIAYTAANTYSIAITKSGVATAISGRNFATVSGGQTPAQIEFYNNNAGNGSNYDAFLNNLTLGYPKIFTQPSPAAQTSVCQNSAANVLSVVAYGSNIGYQWYSNTANSNTGGTLIAGANSDTFSPPTATAGTTYYYCVVNYTGSGNCVAPVSSAASGPVTILSNTTYYADNDGDGFGNAASTISTCSGLPEGYTLDNTDCDDNLLTYVDADGDGFGTEESYSACSGITNLLDCDDNLLTYADADGDGFGSGVLAPCGVSDNSDCNDADNTKHASFPFYVDGDSDSYGMGSVSNVCAVDANTPPSGYSANNTDCNDGNAAVHATYSFYADADSDTYGAGALVSNICAVNSATPPSGYSVNNTDCNDNIAAINPGHTEVLYNGVDDNCNGQLDEGSQLKTKLLASVCGTTLASVGSLIGITTLAQPITKYRIKVTNGASVQVIERNVPHFTLTELASYDYATTYSVEIELQRNGVWLGYYGDACLISSPAVLASGGAAQVSPSQCGVTLARMNTLVATTSLAGVTGYRFRVTNTSAGASGPNVVQTIDRNLNWFSLTMLAQYNYGTTYRVEIAVKTNGAYSGFGSPCEINSPASPTLVNCGGTVSSPNALVAASSLSDVTQYRFQITRQSDNSVTTIDRNTNYFTFAMVPGYTPASQYAVRVAVMTVGTWSPFGDACVITAPGGSSRFSDAAEAGSEITFEATAYPNPFATAFHVKISATAADNINIKVYDMTGRLLESSQSSPSESGDRNLGGNFPSGVYNVIATQGQHVKTLRIIKR